MLLLTAACGRNLPPTGHGEVEDAAGDMSAVFARADERDPGPDLVRVVLDLSATELVATFESATAIERMLDSKEALAPLWFVRIWIPSQTESERQILLIVGKASTFDNLTKDEELVVAVCPRQVRCSSVLREASVDVVGRVITATIPRAGMPQLVDEFDWSAQTSSNTARDARALSWKDYAPNLDSAGAVQTVQFRAN